MRKLADVSVDALRERLHETEDPKAVMRLMIGIAYKHGVGVGVLSERYGVPSSTIYNWLERFETRSISGAVRDESRPGRPPKLAASDRDSFSRDLQRTPETFGYDAEGWSAELAREHLAREYDVSYSTGHVRRLLRQISDQQMGSP